MVGINLASRSAARSSSLEGVWIFKCTTAVYAQQMHVHVSHITLMACQHRQDRIKIHVSEVHLHVPAARY